MIKVIQRMPVGIIGLEASGKVTEDDSESCPDGARPAVRPRPARPGLTAGSVRSRTLVSNLPRPRGTIVKLKRLGVRYSLMDLAELQERRVFFHAPGGPLLEGVFSEPVPETH